MYQHMHKVSPLLSSSAPCLFLRSSLLDTFACAISHSLPRYRFSSENGEVSIFRSIQFIISGHSQFLRHSQFLHSLFFHPLFFHHPHPSLCLSIKLDEPFTTVRSLVCRCS